MLTLDGAVYDLTFLIEPLNPPDTLRQQDAKYFKDNTASCLLRLDAAASTHALTENLLSIKQAPLELIMITTTGGRIQSKNNSGTHLWHK